MLAQRSTLPDLSTLWRATVSLRIISKFCDGKIVNELSGGFEKEQKRVAAAHDSVRLRNDVKLSRKSLLLYTINSSLLDCKSTTERLSCLHACRVVDFIVKSVDVVLEITLAKLWRVKMFILDPLCWNWNVYHQTFALPEIADG